MAKLAIFAALFIALVGIASANTYTTVVTAEVSDESNPMSQQCRKQMQQMKMKQCRMWMRHQMMGGQYEEDSVLRSVVSTNPQYLEECCNELRSFDRDCRCDAIRMMMKDQQTQYGMEKMQKMMKMAENLPMMCNMKSPTKCPMRMVFV